MAGGASGGWVGRGIGVLAVDLHVVAQRAAEGGLGVAQRDAILRALGSCEARLDGAQVELETAGGRVLGVTAGGADLRSAIAGAYRAVEKIRFEGMHYRRDIGRKGLAHYGTADRP